MYLIFEDNNFLFGLSVKEIYKVIDRQSLIFRGDKCFFNDLEIREVEFSRKLNLKGNNSTYKSKLVILEYEDFVKPAILVHGVVGFIKEDVNILKKQDFLNRYGYSGIKGFVKKNGMLVTLIDKGFCLSLLGNDW